MIKRSMTVGTLVQLISKNLEYVETANRNGRLYAGDNVCWRMNAIYSKHYEENVKVESTKTPYTQVGVAMEKIIVNALVKAGIYVSHDVRIPEIEGVPLGGKIDAIIIWNNKPVVLEIKTAGNTLVKEKHRIQAMTYSLYTGLDYIILYLNRNIGKPMFGKLALDAEAHYFSYNDGDALNLYTNICKAAYSSANELLDNTDIPHNKTACRSFYCPFIGYCHEGKKLTGSTFKAMPKNKQKEYKAFIEEKVDWFFNNQKEVYAAFLANLNSKRNVSKRNKKVVLEYYEKEFGVVI